jgi:predicted nucleotidyltransferase
VRITLDTTDVSVPHKAAFDKLIARFEHLDIFAIFGYGSYFTGNYGPNSDIDIYLVTRSSSYERFQINIDGLKFEVTHVGGKRFQSMIENGATAVINGLHRSSILYSKPGVAHRMVELANERFYAGPIEYETPHFDIQIRSRTGTILDDLRDASDMVSINILSSQLVNACFTVLCFRFGLWKLGSKYLIQQTNMVAPEIGQLMSDLISTSEHELIQSIAEKLVEETLAPIGGLLKPGEKVIF